MYDGRNVQEGLYRLSIKFQIFVLVFSTVYCVFCSFYYTANVFFSVRCFAHDQLFMKSAVALILPFPVICCLPSSELHAGVSL